MPMPTHKRSALLAAVTLLALCLLAIRSTHEAPVLTDPVPADLAEIAPRPDANARPPSAATRSRHAASLDRAAPLASRDEPATNGFRRISVHRTTFKHPLIRVVEDFETGIDSPVRSVAMVADLVLVRLEDGDNLRLNSFLRQHPEASIHRTLATGQHALVRIPNGQTPDAFDHWQRQLQAAGLIAEPDYIYHPVAMPNDTDFSQLWGLHNTGQDGGTADADIDAPEAWGITTGSNSVVVAVLDVGVDYNHPDLAANIWSHPTTGKHGRDTYNDDDDPMDDSSSSARAHGHGTHIAGTIAGTGNNNSGVTGVCWNAKIMAIRIGDAATGGMDTAANVEGMRWATDNGAKVLNCSWGGPGGSAGDSLDQEIAYARDHGVIVCCAAGNNHSDNDTSHNYPSDYTADNIISVAASDRNDALSTFSNYGATSVDLAAPGTAIRSTIPNNGYTSHDGTSMATPHVAGAAALVWAADPSLTYSQVRTRLLTKADPKPAFSGKCVSGGRLNVFKAIEDLAGPLLALNRKLAVTTGGNGDAYPNPGETVRLDLTLENTGSDTATTPTIAASLSSGAPATLNRTLFSVADLASHASLMQDNAFTLTLNNPATLPATFTVNLTLTTPTKPAATWTDSIQITVYQSATVSGRVTRAGTGNPIPGATVTVRGPVNLDLTTGTDGRYSAPAVAGSYQLGARATGLLASATRTETLSGTSGDINFAVGTASLALSPAEIHVTVPPNQTRPLTATLRHTGDSPRSIPFATSITGTGLNVDKLYGFDFEQAYMDGTISVFEINPVTGAKIGSAQNITTIPQQEFIRAAACLNDKIWLLTEDRAQAGSITNRLRPLDPATWTLGTAVNLTPPSGITLAGLAATSNSLLMSGMNSTAYPPTVTLYEYAPATGVFTSVGALPSGSRGAFTYSKARSSLFVTLMSMTSADELVRELSYPGLTQIREWTVANQSLLDISWDEQQAALFVVSYPLTGGAAISLSKCHPDTGAAISAFTPVAGIGLSAVNSAASAGWLTTTLTTGGVATGGTASIPLMVNTAGMTLGQTFTAQLRTTSSLTTEPTPVTVNLTIGNLDAGVWEGWFETRYGLGPLPADRLADPDRDGIPAFIEFATGGDPANPAPHAGLLRAQPSADGSALEFSYHRRKSLAPGALVAQSSTDLAAWSTLPASVAGATQTTSTVDATYDRVVIRIPHAGNPRCFVRLVAP